MRGVRKLTLALVIVGLLAIGLGACGSDDSGDSTGGSTAATSAGFRTPGGDNSIQNFGEEADADELDAATDALTAYLQAREEDDWAKQCTLLAKGAVAPLEQLAARAPQFKAKGCAAILETLMGRVPAATRTSTLADGIASLRVEDDHGFALYHGTDGVDYFVPMVKEDGQWKLGAISPSEFP